MTQNNVGHAVSMSPHASLHWWYGNGHDQGNLIALPNFPDTQDGVPAVQYAKVIATNQGKSVYSGDGGFGHAVVTYYVELVNTGEVGNSARCNINICSVG